MPIFLPLPHIIRFINFLCNIYPLYTNLHIKCNHHFYAAKIFLAVIFHRDFVTDKNRAEYIDFLSNLLKDQPYVELAYMTGILPIAKYSSGSELVFLTRN
jgi:hypothetical protein